MRRSTALVVILVALLALMPLARRAKAQAPAPLAGARLDHVAVTVRDIQASLATFTDILGIEAPSTRDVMLDAVAGGKVGWKVAFLNTSNFFIELDQPTTPGPIKTLLDRAGQGINHIGFVVDGSVDPIVDGLKQKGGVVTIGPMGGRVAFVDLTSTIGTTVEIVRAPSPAAAAPKLTSPQALAAQPTNHVGFVYRNAQPAADAFAALLGAAAPVLATFKPIDYRPVAKANRDAHVRFVQIPAGGVSVELIEPVGAPSPWAEHLSARSGNPPHHLAFRYTDQQAFDGAVHRLQDKGGVWTKGHRGVEGAKEGSSPEFDFFGSLGMVVELIGPPAK
jgi:catechol 2,3-dioxygenase-like lactoylglutathione lyase family enzyme